MKKKSLCSGIKSVKLIIPCFFLVFSAISGPVDGDLPDPADQDPTATERETHRCLCLHIEGIPETAPRVKRRKKKEFSRHIKKKLRS